MKQIVLDTEYLLDELKRILRAKNDSALGRILKFSPATMSRIRAGRRPITADFLLSIHESSTLSIQELRNLMGDHRGYFDSKRQKLSVDAILNAF